MPIYKEQCQKCSCSKDYYSSIEDRDNTDDCPVCHTRMKRVIAFESVNCANDDSQWVRSCLEVVSKTDTDPATVEFRNNPTRTNLKNWMQAKGLRHMDPAEKAHPDDRMTERERNEERSREKERVIRGMHELRHKRERIYVGGL